MGVEQGAHWEGLLQRSSLPVVGFGLARPLLNVGQGSTSPEYQNKACDQKPGNQQNLRGRLWHPTPEVWE